MVRDDNTNDGQEHTSKGLAGCTELGLTRDAMKALQDIDIE